MANIQIIDEILAYAGKDISHFFDKDCNPKTRISASGNDLYVFGFFYAEPEWWKNSKYEIGKITSAERRIRIINTLTSICPLKNKNRFQLKISLNVNFHSQYGIYDGVRRGHN